MKQGAPPSERKRVQRRLSICSMKIRGLACWVRNGCMALVVHILWSFFSFVFSFRDFLKKKKEKNRKIGD